MDSFIYIDSAEIYELCVKARTIIQLDFNRVKKEYEAKEKVWDKASWWAKYISNTVPYPNGDIRTAEYQKELKLDRVTTIENACLAAKRVYITFEDLQWLRNHQTI